MTKKSETFKVSLNNKPLLNLRNRFNNHYRYINSSKFEEQTKNFDPSVGIRTPHITWYGWLHEFYSQLMIESIMGLEAYIPASTKFELGRRGLLNEDNLNILSRPSIASKSLAKAYYISVPTLLDEKIAVSAMNEPLWLKIKALYSEIRNPLFHGCEFDAVPLVQFREMYEVLADVYRWADSWHNPGDVIQGANYVQNIEGA